MQALSRVASAKVVPRWADSTIKGRDEILEELRELVGDGESPRLVILEGSRGVGISTLAQEYVNQLRSWMNGRNPVTIHVDVASKSRTSGNPVHGVAVALLQRFSPGGTFQGASAGRIIWWFLRRITAEGRPVIIWLDQVRQNVRSLQSIVRPLMNPGVVMEDMQGIPPVFLVLSGSGDGGVETGAKCIHVPILPLETIREIVQERARQLGRVLAPAALTKVMNILATRGYGLSAMDEVLSCAAQRAGCHGVIVEGDVVPPSSRTCPRTSKRVIELRVLEVLRKARGPVEMGELVQELSRSLASEGERTLSPSSVRRWLIKLEALGLIRRRVIMGGDGGTTSVAFLA